MHASSRLAVLLLSACASASGLDPAGASGDQNARRGELTPVTDFGSNPGRLRMYEHVPVGLSGPAPLVVVLHGCTQTASGYAYLTDWVRLAESDRFLLVFAETRAALGCFAWYDGGQAARGRGQALSVAQMVGRMKRDHAVDGARVFVTGFSAGGYMTTALLSAYPDVFAAGAVLEGGPAGCDETCMAFPLRTREQWAAAFEAGYPGYRGPYPRLLVIHGEADAVVSFANADALVEQWTAVHGADGIPEISEPYRGHLHQVYASDDGTTILELYALTAFGHAIVVDPGDGMDQGGRVGPFAVDGGIWSSYAAAAFFGIGDPLR